MPQTIAIDMKTWRSRPMLKYGIRTWIVVSLLVKLILVGAAMYQVRRAHAQNASLMHRDLPEDERQSLRLSANSWYFQKIDPPSPLKLHDLITIQVTEQSAVKSSGQVDRRKTGKFDADLKNWLKLDGLNLKPAKFANGDPRANGTLDSQYQANVNLQTNDSLTFKIEAEIVDIRPNGNLIVEAHKTIKENENVYERSLTGVVNRDDVQPDRTVKSEQIAELSIDKREMGHVRDGYRRGWLTRFYDRFSIF